MRTHPIGTGPFKFVEFKANESIKLTTQPGLLEEGPAAISTASNSPSLPNRSTAILAFVAGKFDMTFPTEVSIPLLKDVKTPGAERGLRRCADQRLHQHHRQPSSNRRSIIWTSAARWRSRSTARPSSSILFEGQAISAAPWCPPPDGAVGDAEGDAGADPGLWP